MSQNNDNSEDENLKIVTAEVLIDNARYVMQQQSDSIAAIDNKAVGLMAVVTIAFTLFTVNFTPTHELVLRFILTLIQALVGTSFLINLGLLLKTMWIRDFDFGYPTSTVRMILEQTDSDEAATKSEIASALYDAEIKNQEITAEKRKFLGWSSWYTIINMVVIFIIYLVKAAIL